MVKWNMITQGTQVIVEGAAKSPNTLIFRPCRTMTIADSRKRKCEEITPSEEARDSDSDSEATLRMGGLDESSTEA